MTKSPIKLPAPVFDDPKHRIRLYQGDCLELIALLPESAVDLKEWSLHYDKQIVGRRFGVCEEHRS